MSKKLLNTFSLKWNPFSPEMPIEAIFVSPTLESFCWRIENAHVREGGFALVAGDAGTGKSVALRLLASRLERVRDLKVGVFTRPSSNLADFYREMGELFGVPLRPHNRWCGFKALREAWQAHIESTLSRPVLLIDEAQELAPAVLNELRLLSSTRLDSHIILSIVLAGDRRLLEKLRGEPLLPLSSRIRTRYLLEPLTPAALAEVLRYQLTSAGNAHLMTPELADALCDHSGGNLRTLANWGAELLAAAVQQNADRLDEKLFFALTGSEKTKAPSRPAVASARRR